MRSASSEAGASLQQKSYYFLMKINVFFENVLPAAVRSVSREAPLEQEQEQQHEQDALLWNYFSTNLFVFLE